MMTSSIALEGDQEYGLIVQQRGKAQQILFKYLVMVLNYQYGLSIVTAENLNEAAAILRRNTQQIRCLFIVQNEKVQNKMFLYALSLQGKIPLFFLCPFALHGLQAKVVEGMNNIILCAWERAFQKTDNSLGNLMAANLRADGLSKILQESDEVPYEQLQTQIEKRVKGLQTLPAIPEIVLRIMRLVSDPDCDIEALEQLLLNDPAIVQKLLQVVGYHLDIKLGHVAGVLEGILGGLLAVRVAGVGVVVAEVGLEGPLDAAGERGGGAIRGCGGGVRVVGVEGRARVRAPGVRHQAMIRRGRRIRRFQVRRGQISCLAVGGAAVHGRAVGHRDIRGPTIRWRHVHAPLARGLTTCDQQTPHEGCHSLA